MSRKFGRWSALSYLTFLPSRSSLSSQSSRASRSSFATFKYPLALATLTVSLAPGSLPACVMSLPLPEVEAPEYEVEIEDIGIDDLTGKHHFLVGVEVELFNSPDSATCTCSLNLGTTAIPLPPSLRVTQAQIALVDGATNQRFGEENEFEFEDSTDEIEDEIENEIELEEGYHQGSQPFGFATDVSGVASEPLDADDEHRLLFAIEVDEKDLPQLSNLPVQFLAGSDMPGHPLSILKGYQGTIDLSVYATLLCGDLDGDRDVDSNDLLGFIGNWTGDAPNGGKSLRDGDCDGDGDIDSQDLLSLISNWTGVAGANPTPTVPEPATGATALGGLLLGTSWLARHRRSSESR